MNRIKMFVKKYGNIFNVFNLKWILYYFLIFLYGLILMNIEKRTLGAKINLGALCFMLCLYPIFYKKIRKNYNSFITRKVAEQKYYVNHFPVWDSIRDANFSVVEFVIKELIVIALFFLLLIVVLVVPFDELLSFLEKGHNYVCQDNDYVQLATVAFTVSTLLATIFPILVSYLKERCLFFNVYDLPIIKRFNIRILCSYFLMLIYFMWVWQRN